MALAMLVLLLNLVCTTMTNYDYQRLPAHDELDLCKASLVSPGQSVLSIPTGSIDMTVFTVM